MGYITVAIGMAVFIPVVAQASDSWVTALANAGPLGVVLLWFMLRMEKRMTEQTKALDRFSESLLLLITAPVQRCPINENSAAVDKATEMLKEIRR